MGNLATNFVGKCCSNDDINYKRKQKNIIERRAYIQNKTTNHNIISITSNNNETTINDTTINNDSHYISVKKQEIDQLKMELNQLRKQYNQLLMIHKQNNKQNNKQNKSNDSINHQTKSHNISVNYDLKTFDEIKSDNDDDNEITYISDSSSDDNNGNDTIKDDMVWHHHIKSDKHLNIEDPRECLRLKSIQNWDRDEMRKLANEYIQEIKYLKSININ